MSGRILGSEKWFLKTIRGDCVTSTNERQVSMGGFRQFIKQVMFQLRSKGRVVGWNMNPEEAVAFFEGQGKTVLTFFGYMAGYENEEEAFRIVREVLSKHSPESTLVNDGVTKWGLGEMYPIAKSMGFTTAGIVSKLILEDPLDISDSVDHICFMNDDQWGGKLPNSDELSPTSRAMVDSSNILVAIGGNDICLDELLAGKERGKTIHYYPAEVKHEWAIRRAKRMGLPEPKSFWGSVHDVFGK
jgi:hypothetical protein